MMYTAIVFLILSAVYGVVSLLNQNYAVGIAWMYGTVALALLIGHRFEERRRG